MRRTRLFWILILLLLRASGIAQQDTTILHLRQENGLWGLVNWKGKVVTPFKYYSLFGPTKGYYVAHEADSNNRPTNPVIINSRGKITVPIQYDRIDNPINVGSLLLFMAAIENQGKGYITGDGQIIIPVRYTELGYFKADTNMFVVSRYEVAGHRIGLIDRKEQFYVPMEFDDIGRLNDSLYIGKYTEFGFKVFCNKKQVHQFDQYEDVSFCWPHPFIVARQDGLIALVDASGKPITEFKYTEYTFNSMATGTIKMKGEHGWQVLDEAGVVVAEN